MSEQRQVLIRVSDGRVLACGFCTFTPAAGEQVLEYDGPALDLSQALRWNGSAFVLDTPEQLVLAKERAFARIDDRTDALIAQGYEYPPSSGNRFELSLEAQARLLALLSLRENPAMSYPIVFNTLDDLGTVQIADAAAVEGMVLIAVGTYRALIDSGTALKGLVRACTSVAEIEAVVDPRGS